MTTTHIFAHMGKEKIAPNVGGEPIGTVIGIVAAEAVVGSTGMGKGVVPPSKGTVVTGESSGGGLSGKVATFNGPFEHRAG